MTARDVLQQLHALGAVLTPYPDETLHYKAPKGTVTPALLDGMRQQKPELHALVEAWSERAAIAEYCGGLAREDAERLAWAWVLTPHAECVACGYKDGPPPQERLRQP
jgi:TubC N-terminal docking domain